jgi:hypothetical protein
MAVATSPVGENRGLLRHAETGSANTALATTIAGFPGQRLVQVIVAYSAAPTQTGVVTSIDSGAGAGYDATLNTGTANARYTVYNPGGDLVLGSDDSLIVTCPAGGAGITASVTVYTEQL